MASSLDESRTEVRRIGLILSGGVSLGAYQAGALTEILYALEHVNKSSAKDESIQIDVLTGASAGSITAALAARIIMHRSNRRDDLHKVWVREPDIDKMLDIAEKIGLDGSTSASILSNQFQKDLANRYILDPDGDRDPASCAPEKLYLHFALSNLAGVDYELQYAHAGRRPLDANNATFPTTLFSDQSRETIEYKANYDKSLWQRIVDAAIASGSFPFAFPPFPLTRQKRHYDSPLFSAAQRFPSCYAFTDGGLFNNEPIGQAIDLARQADDGKLRSDRIFILIDPNMNVSGRDDDYCLSHACQENEGLDQSLVEQAARLLKMVFGEAQVQDWMRTSNTSDRARWRDMVGEVLRVAIAEVSWTKMTEVKEKLDAIQNDIMAVDDAFGIATERRDDGSVPSVESVERDLLRIIDRVAGLENKKEIRLFAIGARGEQTAGENSRGFAGFFKQEWREHDYRLGRRHAHRLLPEFLGISPYPPAQDVEYQVDPSWGDLSKATIADAGEAKRKRVERRLGKRTKEVIEGILKRSGGIVSKWFFRKLLAALINRVIRRCFWKKSLGL